MDLEKIGSTNRSALRNLLLAGVGLLCLQTPIYAYDFNERISIGGILAGAGQRQAFDEGDGQRDACRGALPFRPHLSFRPTEQDELYVELGFAAGNGLNKVSPFKLAPWAADLEDDLKDINGRGRNYLLSAWYRHEFQLAPDNQLSVAIGLIDATDFLDANAFATDEYTQFMNEAFASNPEPILPSYDRGVALQWDLVAWSLRALYMNVGKDEEEEEDRKKDRFTNRDFGEDYDYFGVEVGYAIQTRLGGGHYRLIHARTSRDFVDSAGRKAERLSAFGLSFDQELGDGLGAFLRIDTNSDKASIAYRTRFSGGLDIKGRGWGREKDNIGLAFAYLDGGNQDIKHTQVAEAYYRLVLHEQFALSADLQYMKDDKKSRKDPGGFIVGLRADIHF
jgi:porin